MAIQPDTDIRLIKSPLTLSNKHQITFANDQAQANYFLSLPYVEDQNASYQRKDNVIRFNSHIDNIIMYNYCMYKNNNYSNRWFYAFITSMRYINDSLTEVSIVTDVFQTWQFDLIFKQSFVEREIVPVSSDVPGNYLIPEGLEFGELKVQGTASFDDLKPIAIIAYSRNPNEDGFTDQTITSSQGVIANGIPNGMFYWIVSFDYLQGALDTINKAGHGDSIITVFTVPAFALIGFNGWSLQDILSGVSWWFVGDYKANPVTKTLISTPSSLDGYTPRNQKLRTYPYLYLGYNPTNGSSKIFRYEDFTNGTPIFKMISEVSQNPTICFIPQNYRGASGDSISDLVTLQGYPTLGWITDFFNVWLAQNSETINLQMEQEKFNYNIEGIRSGANLFGNIAEAGMSGFSMDASGIKNGLMGTINSSLDVLKLDKDHEF